MSKSKFLKSLVGFLVSIILIVWLYYSIEWKIVWEHFQTINYFILIPIFILLILHFYIRAFRWKFLLPKNVSQPRLNVLFDCIMMGNFATYILPLRAGEFIRPYLLSQLSDYSFSASFSSVIVERFFDLATVLFTFAFVVTQVEGLPDWSKHGALVLGVMALCIMVFIIVGSIFPRQVLSFAKKFTNFLPESVKHKVNKFLEDFLSSAEVVGNIRQLIYICLLSILVWLECYLLTYVGFYMLPGNFSFLMGLTVSVVVALAVAAPSAPGFIGVYQTACIAAFQIFGYDREWAVTYSIITHLANYALFALASVVFCLRNDFKFTHIFKVGK